MDNEKSLNAYIGSKAGVYIDQKHEVIKSPTEYMNLWIEGLTEKLNTLDSDLIFPHKVLYDIISGEKFPYFKKYLSNFLECSFLKHYDEHYKVKPTIKESEYWFGNNSDEFGFLISPRFVDDSWENDKSEIRHFKQPYWTLGHALETGFCYMNQNDQRTFSTLVDLLQFLYDLVRRTGSKYQISIYSKYIDYVKNHGTPESIPVLIPELRYDPFKKKHKYRLDFLIINPWSMDKIGFEISPSSTHMKLKGKNKNLTELEKDAYLQYEKEMIKHKKYWSKYNINYITFTDTDLNNLDNVWANINNYLSIDSKAVQLNFSLLNALLDNE